MKQTWTTQDKRTLQISEITLDHLLNIVHDTHFRVARMRKVAVDALGGIDNPNVNGNTKGAFINVRPADVFPSWKTVIRYARKRFQEKFKLEIGEVRRAVFDAWEHGSTIESKYEEAVRFLLCDSAKTIPPRLVPYVSTFRPGSDEQYRVMCWNLRRDQPILWNAVSRHDVPLTRLFDRIPPNRLNSAMKFEQPPRVGLDEDDIFSGQGIWDGDIPFSAGR